MQMFLSKLEDRSPVLYIHTQIHTYHIYTCNTGVSFKTGGDTPRVIHTYIHKYIYTCIYRRFL